MNNPIKIIKRWCTPKRTKAYFFKPEFACLDKRKEHLSASGRYRLVVTYFTTGKGSWNYTQGLVYSVGSEQPIAEIQRNYSSFPFLFVENHPNGHQYLICGEDYQGQTVIELDTGKRRDLLPEEAKKGHGFCWSSYKFHAPTQLVIVSGCFWGGGYEYKFFDFSEPLNGWPELETDFCVDTDEKEPSLESDGSIKCYQTKDPYEDEDREEDTPVDERVLASIVTLKREDGKLVKLDEWVSEAEQKDRADREEGNRKYEAHWKEYKETDTLYLLAQELKKNPVFSPSSYDGRGFTYNKWCPTWKGEETRMIMELVKRTHPQKRSIVILEWAVKTGPIKVVVWRKRFWQKKTEQLVTWFEHSETGMRNAFAHAVTAARG